MSKHLGDKLIDYAWGLLSAQEQAGADAHLRDCKACRVELARHRAITAMLAATVPASLPNVPSQIRSAWVQVAARVPHLRGISPTPKRRGSPGFVGAGLAITTAAILFVVMTTQALLGLGHPPLTATAFYATQSATPIASATHTPERPTAVATPVVVLYTLPMQAPRPPALTTARP